MDATVIDWAGVIKARRKNPPKFRQWSMTAAELLAARRQMQWDFSGADLDSADLRWADLSLTDLSGADLSHANLVGTALWGAKLNGADLHNANLHRANLWHADLRNTTLSRAALSGANLDETIGLVQVHGVGAIRRTVYAVEHVSGPMYLLPFSWGTYEQTVEAIEEKYSWPKAASEEYYAKKTAIEKGCYLAAMKELGEKLLENQREYRSRADANAAVFAQARVR